MKVYALPKDVPAPKVDYRNYDRDVEMKKEKEHSEALKAWLVKAGYTGKNTGKTICFPVADGHAEYMLGEGRKSILIHLPYGDGYSYPDVRFLPKAEIMRRIKADEGLAKLFAEKKKEAA